VEIPKNQILELLRSRGDHDKAEQADHELPDKVDPDQHGDRLSKHGLDPADALGKLGL
jgi:hypothetical protein